MLKRGKAFRALTAQLIGIALVASAFLLLPQPLRGQAAQAPDQLKDIHVFVSIMDPQVVADTFGKRIAQRFVAIQVTIGNHNKDYQYLINDVSLDLANVFPKVASDKAVAATKKAQRRDPNFKELPPYYTLSSAELSLLRGVAEKGQGQDQRNKILRLFRGLGTVAAGLIGVASFGASYPAAVAVFNGPVINAYSEAFPDYTINQMNRLSDSAYQANTLVPQKHSKVIVAFIPQGIFLNKQQQRRFFDDPTSLYPDSGKCQGTDCVDFRLAEAYVDGDFITQVTNLPPTVTTAQFDGSELQKFEDAKPMVKGYISGRFLTGTTISLLNQDPKGLSIALDGPPTSDRVNFIIRSDKPVPPGTGLDFEVANDQGVQRYRKNIGYMPDLPTLTAISQTSGKQNTSVAVALTGTNFIPGAGNMKVNVSGSDIDVTDPVEVVGTSLKVTLRIGPSAATGARNVTVVNANGESSPVTFTINAAGGTP